jgi:acetolactate synthase-1/2/3 large subunit
MSEAHGGAVVSEKIKQRGVSEIFTLCGGHISPILVSGKQKGLDIVDVRDEASAVFGADAVSRLTGTPGVAAVTAGPGVTNTVTAVKNAQQAKSPVIIIGGAAATLLKGRGALQDIDQMSVMEPVTKWATRITKRSSLKPTLDKAFDVAQKGVPGPVFIEIPIDLLYGEELVRDWYAKQSGVEKMSGPVGKAFELYLKGHLTKLFKAPHVDIHGPREQIESYFPKQQNFNNQIKDVSKELSKAHRPVLIAGSQTLVNKTESEAKDIASAIESLNVPTFLGGTARGLLGRTNDIQFRHKRTAALKQADLVLVAGFPFDFRLGYGQKINRDATVVSANLSPEDLTQNRRPEYALEMHPGEFLQSLDEETVGPTKSLDLWFDELEDRELKRDAEIAEGVSTDTELVDPVYFFQRMEEHLEDDSVLVVDGGDFVGTAAYILRPRGPLRWLDPGVFGTLGVGGGFALGACQSRPDSQVWLVYGDGSSGYSLAEFDTFARHDMAPIAVIGTDASWAQIERAQVDILEDDCATTLRRTEYHKVADGYGGKGILVTDPDEVDDALQEAKELAAQGDPVAVNIHLADSDFREGSLSM